MRSLSPAVFSASLHQLVVTELRFAFDQMLYGLNKVIFGLSLYIRRRLQLQNIRSPFFNLCIECKKCFLPCEISFFFFVVDMNAL